MKSFKVYASETVIYQELEIKANTEEEAKEIYRWQWSNGELNQADSCNGIIEIRA